MNETGATKKSILMFNKFIMLPLKSQLEDIDEVDLCSRFILPTLRSLFDEQFGDKHILVKLSNVKKPRMSINKVRYFQKAT